MEFVTEGSPYRLEVTLTVLGVILSSVDADLDTLSFKVVEILNGTLNLVGRNPREIGLNPKVPGPDSTECLIKVLLFVLIQEVLVKHWVELHFEVSHIHLRVNSAREVIVRNTCHISVHLCVHYHWPRQYDDLQYILIIYLVHGLLLIDTNHIVTVDLENRRDLASHIHG